MKFKSLNLLTICFFAAAIFIFNSCADSEEMDAPVFQEEIPIINPFIFDDNDGVSLRTDCNGNDIHWEYEGPEGPDHWGMLCGDWTCDGNAQSPVDIIPPKVRRKSKSLYFYWKPSSTHIVNNGHTIQFNYDQPDDLDTNPNQGSYLKLNGKKYHLLQFHFHTASEHTVNGEHSPAEVHFVHQSVEDKDLVVIGVFIDEGADSPFFDKFLANFPTSEGDYDDDDEMFKADMLAPQYYNDFYKQHFWYYNGSLTTPPCSEIVSWFVMTDHVTASHDQLAALEAIIHENYRPVQPLNSRLVKAQ